MTRDKNKAPHAAGLVSSGLPCKQNNSTHSIPRGCYVRNGGRHGC
jgi:hypothetical protein